LPPPYSPTNTPGGAHHPRARNDIRFFSGLLKLGLVVGVLGLLALAAGVAVSLLTLPSFQELQRTPQGQTVQVLAADGSPLVTVGPSYGEWLAFDRIPSTMTAAMIAVEDRRFYSHPGVDPIGMAAAAKDYAIAGRARGASTITQQLARNIFLTQARTAARKLREVVLALALEQRFSKREILELYLNRVYFGGGAYGIDAASRRFFGHPATHLSLSEAAVIAGLVKAPSHYAPSADPAAAKERAATVIAVMHETGDIPAGTDSAADMADLRFAPQPRQNDVRYFTDWALQQLDQLTEETAKPLVVTTTLDSRAQTAAEAAIKAETPPGAQGAAIAMAKDGAIRAMVGGRDYVDSNYNRAVVAKRQPGSSFKLFVYLAALEDGVQPDATEVDEPVTVDGWSPRNDNHRYTGPVSVTDAFARSINTVAVKLAESAGFDTVAAMARRLGVTSTIDTRPAMALGASDVTLLEMTTAYAGVAAGGVRARPYGILRVATSQGDMLWTREPDAPETAIAPDIAAKMTGLLKAAVETGTGRQAQMGRELAGKTGTTSSNKDGWFLGFTSDLVGGVWMGRDDAKPVAGLAGGRAPARAFAALMRVASRGTPSGVLQTEAAQDPVASEPDAETYGAPPPPDGSVPPDADAPSDADPNAPPPTADGEALGPGQTPPRADPRLDQRWLNGVLKDREPG